MAKKKVGVWMDEGVARRLDEMAERFEGQKGEIVSAAVDMFLRAAPEDQRSALESVMKHKLNKLFGNPDLRISGEVFDAAAKRSREESGSSKRDPK